MPLDVQMAAYTQVTRMKISAGGLKATAKELEAALA